MQPFSLGLTLVKKVVTMASQEKLSSDELGQRAKRLKLVLSDNDGVLTDAGVYYSDTGEALKRFSLRDGMGVERLRNAGIATAIITRENSQIVARRAEKLRLPHVYLGIWNKREHLDLIVEETGYSLQEMAYIGDDVNDLACIESIGALGLTGSPADAIPEIRSAVHYVCEAKGGYGAFRDFAEWLLHHRDSGSVSAE